MFVVLDTHVLIWLDQDDPSHGTEARKLADLALKKASLLVSAISFWEIAILIEKSRISLAMPVLEWRSDLLRLGLVEIPVDGFEKWRPLLEATYLGVFADLVFGKMPDMEEIVRALGFLHQNFRSHTNN